MTKKPSIVWITLFASLLLLFPLPGYTESKSDSGSDTTLAVYDPSGATRVRNLHAQRLPAKKAAHICELSDHMWEAHRTFPLIRKLLKEKHPSWTVVPYDVMPNIYGVEKDKLLEAVRSNQCDAAIVGNAG